MLLLLVILLIYLISIFVGDGDKNPYIAVLTGLLYQFGKSIGIAIFEFYWLGASKLQKGEAVGAAAIAVTAAIVSGEVKISDIENEVKSNL